jgi:type IX secretion system PorP/SprF family membrane protein
MLRGLIYIILLLGIGTTSYSQLQPLLDQYQFNGLAINPAYAGSQGALNIGLYSRNQWVGFEGAPRTYTFSMHSPLRNKKVNLGLIMLGDRLGSKRETGFLLNYAYRIDMGRGKWSIGLAAGVSNISTDLSSLKYIDMADRLLQNPGQSTWLPEFSVGSYYYTERYFAGFSMPLFLSHYTDEGNGSYQLKFKPGEANYILTAGYLFELSDGIELMPSFLLKSNPANNTQLDIHFNLILKEKVWVGAGIRTNGSLSALLQMQVNPQLRIGYSYGYELSELSSYQHGSHEVMLQYNFRYILDVKSPRYF